MIWDGGASCQRAGRRVGEARFAGAGRETVELMVQQHLEVEVDGDRAVRLDKSLVRG